MSVFAKVLSGLGGSRPPGLRASRDLLGRADAARDSRDCAAAAALYEEALANQPGMAAIHIQAGHMFKETGRFQEAERHYLEASRLTPDDPDLALQLGHFYKVSGRPIERDAAYRRALELRPGWAPPRHELAEIRRAEEPPPLDPAWAAAKTDPGCLAPELAPRLTIEAAQPRAKGVYIARLGALRERGPWGLINTLRGVEAIRGHCMASSPISELRVELDDTLLSVSPVEVIPLVEGSDVRTKYVFNVWVDVSEVAPGPHRIALRLGTDGREVCVHVQHVIVAPSRTEAEFPDSDSVVELAPGDRRSAEAQIRGRASVVRSARRSLLPRPIRNVLVVRSDQLGDLVVSIPALRRLRALFHDARLVALLTAANAELAATLAIFDEIIVVDFPDDPTEAASAS